MLHDDLRIKKDVVVDGQIQFTGDIDLSMKNEEKVKEVKIQNTGDDDLTMKKEEVDVKIQNTGDHDLTIKKEEVVDGQIQFTGDIDLCC